MLKLGASAFLLAFASLNACKPREYRGGVKAVNADTELSAVPWVEKATVALVGYDQRYERYPGDPNPYRVFCTGTLVNRHTVVTAGHCLSFSFFQSKPKKVFVLFDTKLDGRGEPKLEQIKTKLVEVSMKDGISVHPRIMAPSSLGSMVTGVKTKNRVSEKEKSLGRKLNVQEAIELHRDLRIFDYDIAVLRLPSPAPDNYVPIAVASESDQFADDGFSAGYGLAFWYLPGFAIQAQWETQGALGHQRKDELRATTGTRAELLEGKTLFVKHRDCDGVMCTMAPGDSGGPYFQKNASGEWRLVGVLSGPCDLWNNHQGDKIPPMPCTRYQYLPASADFIRQNQTAN